MILADSVVGPLANWTRFGFFVAESLVTLLLLLLSFFEEGGGTGLLDHGGRQRMQYMN